MGIARSTYYATVKASADDTALARASLDGLPASPLGPV